MTDEEKEKYRGGLIATCKTYCHIDYDDDIEIKTVHFIMQNIVAEKMLSIVEVEQVEKEASAFDDYDRENGYEDEDEQPEENQWKVCGEIVDRVVKIAIRLLKNSYSQCMKENIVTLLDYLKFELDTINENQ